MSPSLSPPAAYGSILLDMLALCIEKLSWWVVARAREAVWGAGGHIAALWGQICALSSVPPDLVQALGVRDLVTFCDLFAGH